MNLRYRIGVALLKPYLLAERRRAYDRVGEGPPPDNINPERYGGYWQGRLTESDRILHAHEHTEA